MKKEELHRFDSPTGTTKVRKTRRGDIVIDSYMGDITDNTNHDRVSLNVTKGTLSGHGYGHNDNFDTSKNNKSSKVK